MGVFLFLVIFVFAILVGFYLLSSAAIFKVLHIYDYSNAWMAWIPFLNFYALADAASEGHQTMQLFGHMVPLALFEFWWVIAFILNYVPFIGWMLSFAVQIIFLGTVFSFIYARVEHKPIHTMTALGFISGIVPLIAYIKFLAYPKDKLLYD